MKLESILISDDNMNLSAVVAENNVEEQQVKETIDFKMVTFSLSGKDYAIDIMYVKEIAKAGKFTYVPNTLPFVVGVYNLRGEIIPILDMRVFFNVKESFDETDENKLQNLLILNVDGQVFGIIVDKIDKVVGIQKSTIQPPHPLFADINIKYIYGVVESNKRLYILLDIERIFSKSKSESEPAEEKHFAVSAKNAVPAQNSKKADENVALKTEEAPVSAEKTESADVPEVQTAEKSVKNSVQTDFPENNVCAAVDSCGAKNENPKEAAQAGGSAEYLQEPQSEKASDAESADYGFVVEGLKSYANFFVSPINEQWVKHRFVRWIEERKNSSVQLQGADDAKEFLKDFWSPFSNSWWSKEYAESLFKVLPENSAKQIVVWNPGCGSGIETYCLACVLLKKYPDSKIRLYAQDIDLLGVSNAPMLNIPDDAPTEWFSEYLSETASGAKTFNQQVKDCVMFEYHDCRHTNALPMVDLIFARDLLSLIDEDSQNSVFSDFVEKLKGNGVLILGENEVVPDASEFLEHTEKMLTAFSKQ